MIDAAYYLLQVTLCSGTLYGYYLLALRNEVYHHWNRYYLLATVGLSLLLPAIRIPVRPEAAVAKAPAVRVLEVVATGDAYVEALGRSEALMLSTGQWLLLGYAAVGLGVLLVLLHALWRIRRILRRHPQVELEGCRLVVTRERGTPFSFLKYVFWHADVPLATEAGQRMLAHELAHVRERHTYDKLILGAALVPCWANPFLWLIRREMAMIHEFIADRRSVDGPDGAALAAMLLEASFPGRSHLLTHPFFHSPLKRRLKMIHKARNTRTSYITRILALPLLALVAAAFTLRPAPGPTPLPKNPDAPAFTVVIDAGHGGPDAGVQAPDGRITEKDLTLAIARRIRDLNPDPTLQIVLLREKDEFQPLRQKVERSLALRPDAFVSIHINGAGPEDGPQSGIEVFLGTRNKRILPASRQLGSLLHANLSRIYPTLDTLRTRSQGIWVLDAPEIDYPAAIVECGYLTNPEDRAFLSAPANLDALARSILEGIAGYRTMQLPQARTRPDTVPSGRIPVGGVSFRVDGRTEDLERVLLIINGEKLDFRDVEGKTIQGDSAIFYPRNDPEALARYGLEGKNGVLEFRKAVVGQALSESGKTSFDTVPGRRMPDRYIIVRGKALGKSSSDTVTGSQAPDRYVIVQGKPISPLYAAELDTVPTPERNMYEAAQKAYEAAQKAYEAAQKAYEAAQTESRRAGGSAPSAAKADPLVIIDGNRIGRMSTAKLDAMLAPDRIARIDVLKGEAAIARYGEEGRNGVIVVHSKAYEAAQKEGGRKH